MTIAELIAVLSRFPGETKVLVDGYEAGYDDIDAVVLLQVVLDTTWHPYEGDFIDAEQDLSRAAISAVIISR